MLSFMDQEVTIVRPSWVDDRGTLVPDYDNPDSEETVERVSVQPGANFSAEERAARQGVTVRYSVHGVPPHVQVGPHDAVRFEGVLYELDGAPAPWRSPTGSLSHQALVLVDWSG